MMVVAEVGLRRMPCWHPCKSVKRQPVTIAEVVDDQVNVTDGLSEGAQIVSAGVSQLQEGMTIRPVAGIGD